VGVGVWREETVQLLYNYSTSRQIIIGLIGTV